MTRKIFSSNFETGKIVRPKRVLVVENDSTIQYLLRRLLQRIPDLLIDVCSGGIDALINVGAQTPDLLILDVRIPQINGFEICKLLRSNRATQQVKIIAVTGEILTSEERSFLLKTTDDLFTKPFNTSHFLGRASELLGIYAQ